jgi:hypothetical protein
MGDSIQLIGEWVINKKILNNKCISKYPERYAIAINRLKQYGNYDAIIEYVIEHPDCRHDMSHMLIEEIIRKELKFVPFIEIILFNDNFWDRIDCCFQNAHIIRTNAQLIEAVKDYEKYDNMDKLAIFLTTNLKIKLPIDYSDSESNSGSDSDAELIERDIKYIIKEDFEFRIESIRVGTQYKIKSYDGIGHTEYIEYYETDEWVVAGSENVKICRKSRKEFFTFLKAVILHKDIKSKQSALQIFFAKKMNTKYQEPARHISSFI